MKNQRIENIIEELIDQYKEEDRYNRPWIIGFSGGKDSTVHPFDKNANRQGVFQKVLDCLNAFFNKYFEIAMVTLAKMYKNH